MDIEKSEFEITDKMRQFVDEYLIDLNATQAAIRAGYSEATAQEQSSQLLARWSKGKKTELIELK